YKKMKRVKKMIERSITKLLSVSALSLGVLFSTNAVSYAAENTNQPSIEQTDIEAVKIGGVEISKDDLNKEQLKEYKKLIKDGYTVSIQKNEQGYVTISGYKTESTSLNSSSQITPQVVVGDQRFNISQAIYYGYTHVGEITGWIDVEYIGSTVYPRKHSLYVSGAYGDRVSYSYGNPGKVYYNFTKVVSNGSMSGTGPVPFQTRFDIYSNGTMKFWNDLSLYD
ncbi:hypothetical protein, partial [Anoxybacillus sp. J5B_2022]|uniref:hypothetical protein n=1 Tax=Anoxybacillus sp. J5B_2022 TaxID=3003246 RepID=UPI0022868C7F